MLCATVSQFDFGAHGSQQFARSFDIANLRDIFQSDGLVGEQGSGHGRQGRILGSADTDCPQQRITAADYEFIHIEVLLVVI
jgi:hypothetical protein